MSQQMTDPFIWNRKEYVFLGADDVYSLFDPNKYDLEPTEPDTSCYKGFIAHFLVKNNQIYISKLEVYCEDGHYPIINNVKPHKKMFDSFWVYKNLNLKLNYTGTIIIGTELSEAYIGRAFTGPHSYKQTYDLDFVDGLLVSSKESTGNYFGF